MKPWRSYPEYLKSIYGAPVYRIGIDGGFSCPNRGKDGRGGCSFCDGTGAVAVYQRKGESGFFRNSCFSERTASSLLPRLLSVESQAERGKSFLEKRYGATLFSLYFQSYTNTYGSVEDLRAIYDRALSTGDYKELIISTRPDCLSDAILSLLVEYSARIKLWLEIGLQSANDDTLRRIGRGHTVADYISAVQRVHSLSIPVVSHIVLGLPGESRADYLRTIEVLNEVGIEGVKIHNLNIPGGTRLGEEYISGCITAPSMERHVEDTELCLRHLRPEAIIERLICETPSHRLMAPRSFPDKFIFLRELEKSMVEHNAHQGDLYGKS